MREKKQYTVEELIKYLVEKPHYFKEKGYVFEQKLIRDGFDMAIRDLEELSSQPTEEQCKHEPVRPRFPKSLTALNKEYRDKLLNTLSKAKYNSIQEKSELPCTCVCHFTSGDHCNVCKPPHSIQEIEELDGSDFTWLEGDTYYINESGIKKLIKAVSILKERKQ